MPPNKLKSKIWNYFNKTGDKEAVCKICNKNLKTSGNTTNLRGHLENVHSQQWQDSEVPSKKPRRVSNITDYIDVYAATPANDHNVDLQSTSNSDVNVNPLTSSSSVKDKVSPQNSVASNASTLSSIVVHGSENNTQPNVDDFINNIKSITTQDGAKSKKITEAIVNFIIMDNKPFSTVEVENMKPKNEMILQCKAEIKKQLARRFDSLEHCSILAISTTLDPRFKFMHFKDAVAKSKVINYLNKYLREYNSLPTAKNDTSDESDKDDTEFDIWKYHKQLTQKNMKNKSSASSATAITGTISETEVQMYLSSPVTPIKKDAIEIWDDMKSLFPKLAKIAMIYLPIIATSVQSERLFSEAGATITQERNRLLETRLSKLLFLNSISKLLKSNK
ncbi:hypothetical protein ILUMI_10522 [Ignelater luminosus]|uniref:BED-type domain-containing protein n=1 Tax=Ignelater luminosus TaxID=2038154 RepID=A0A8K0GEW4_IGNLU|nr:hypothetical protein ILUMI_10522 [Ignelater luminosus]